MLKVHHFFVLLRAKTRFQALYCSEELLDSA